MFDCLRTKLRKASEGVGEEGGVKSTTPILTVLRLQIRAYLIKLIPVIIKGQFPR